MHGLWPRLNNKWVSFNRYTLSVARKLKNVENALCRLEFLLYPEIEDAI